MVYDFESIAGYEAEKEELKRLCSIFNDRKRYEEKGAKLPKGVIFYGDAGTGKTLFAKVLASVCQLRMSVIDLADAGRETSVCRKIRKAFRGAARSGKPTMIFFDELDKMLPNAEEEYVTDRSKAVLAQLLTLIDGMESKGNVVFVATCNDYDALPDTLVRPGRIDKKIFLGKPTCASRRAILEMYAQKSKCRFEIEMGELAALTKGFSCAALETLVNECVLLSDAENFVSEKLIKERILEIETADIPREQSSAEDLMRACRNVGSFIVARSLNDGNYVLDLKQNTVCNAHFNAVLSEYDSDYDGYDGDEYDGYDDYDDEDDDDDYDYDDEDDDFCDDDDENDGSSGAIYSAADYLNAATVRCGGYIAEQLVCGDYYDNLKFDFDLVEKVIRGLCGNGMFGLEYHFSASRHEKIAYPAEKVARVNALIESKMEECYARAKQIVEKNEALIRKLILILCERRSVDKEHLEPILAEEGGVR